MEISKIESWTLRWLYLSQTETVNIQNSPVTITFSHPYDVCFVYLHII